MADYGFLLGAVSLLLIVGLVMVLSASTVVSYRGTGSSYTLFFRQLMFAGIGVAAMMLLSRMPVAFFRRIAPLLIIIAFVMLLLVLVPGIGVEVNGQRNWIQLGGPFRLQPSEFAKFALVVWTADLIARRREIVDGWRSLLIPLAPVAGSMILLILLEGDLGTTLVMMPAVAAILLVAGAPMKLFGWMGAAIGSMILLMSITTPYRLQRFATWLDPAADPDGAGYQILHGQYALATGGWWGVGLGASREKWGFLPEAQTDFILAVIGEELGLVGTLSVLVLFAIIAYVIWQIASKADSDFVRLATVGVGIWIVVQALINVGAVLGAVPITGLPLPLVSYGGSSLTFTLMAVGMLLALARSQPAAQEFLETRKAAKRNGKSRSGRLSARVRRRDDTAGRRARRAADRHESGDEASQSSRRRSRKTSNREEPTGRRRRAKESSKREKPTRRARRGDESVPNSRER